MAPDVKDQNAQDKANEEAAHKEAYAYWGYLIREDKCGTDIFNRLLEGIAEVVSQKFEPGQECPDLTPQRLAAFYRAVGGNYDVLFIETPPSDISFIYRSLGAFHSLQPAPDDDGYSYPTVPALKKKGFVAWQTIQLLLGPEEHVPYLQNAVKKFDIKDPHTGNLFPKILPKECLPQEPDDAMEAWYETVAERLKKEAEENATNKEGRSGPRVHVNIDEHAPRTSSEMSDEGARDQRYAAASYFADPLYRNRNRRPPIARHISKETREARRYEEEKENRGRLINSVRHMLNPFGRDRSRDRRKSHPASGRYDPQDDDYSDDDDNDRTPMASHPPHVSRYMHAHGYPVSQKRPHPPRRESSLSSTDTASDSDRPSSRRRTPAPGHSPGLRRRRSHDAHDGSRDYFSSYYDDRDRRYSHDVSSSSSFGGGMPLGPDAVGSGLPGRKNDALHPPIYPTKGPIFATHVAHMQPHTTHHTYYNTSPSRTPERRPTMNMGGTPLRSSYRGSPATSGMRYSAPPPPAPVPPPPAPAPPPPDIHEPAYLRERVRDRDRERDYPRERDPSPYSPLSGAGNTRHRRRLSEDIPRQRDRDGGRTARSHERVRDEWDQRVSGSREPSLNRSRSDGRDRGSGGGRHRYMSTIPMSGVEGGVGGRRYPVDTPWR